MEIKSTAIRLVISFLLIIAFIFVGLIAFIITGLSGKGDFYSILIPVLFVLLSILLILWTLRTVKLKILLSILTGIILCSTTAIFFYEQRRSYIASIPTISDREIALYLYQPFIGSANLSHVDGEATLALKDNLPKIDGATALYPLYASFVEAVYPFSEYDPYTSDVRGGTTPVAYQRLLDGEVDVIFCAAPSKAQIEDAHRLGKKFNLTPIGREAFVFFVNKENPVDELSVSQVQDIYSGIIKNWHDVGGQDDEIKAYQRPKNSGSQTMLEKIMDDKPLMMPLENNRVGGMGAIIERTAEYKNFNNAIGYTFLYFATEMVANDAIKLLKINGVYPDSESIEKGSYPFCANFYAVTTDTENENVDKLIDWILSDQGQYIVSNIGYTSIK